MSRLWRRGRGSKVLLAVGLAGATFGVVAAVQAAIPDEGGVIHGCYQSNGDLRVIDTAASKKDESSCKSGETPLDWNQTGPPGPKGDQGPPGPPGAGTVYHASVYLNGIPSVVGNSPEFVGSSRIGTGLYNVSFSVNVSRCGRVATLGIPSDQENNSDIFKGFKGEISTFFDLANNALAVATFDSSGTPDDQDFQVIVVC